MFQLVYSLVGNKTKSYLSSNHLQIKVSSNLQIAYYKFFKSNNSLHYNKNNNKNSKRLLLSKHFFNNNNKLKI